ncbi:hypothetical protein MRX96_032325 [Rhipicephalus microplus]
MLTQRNRTRPRKIRSRIFEQLTALLERQATPDHWPGLHTRDTRTRNRSQTFRKSYMIIAMPKPSQMRLFCSGILPVTLSGSAARWRRRQSFDSWSHFEQLFRAEFLPPNYVDCMKD